MAKEKVYNKLVRDKVLEIIEAKGGKPVFHAASDQEYADKLVEKLLEELEEFKANPSEKELADVLEVIHALCEAHGFDLEKVEEEREKKKQERGGFAERLVLEKVVEE